jgi:molybdate transport system substrate-binding protein
MNKVLRRAAAAAVLLFAHAAVASAAEIKVFSTVGVKNVMEELIPKFEKASGDKLAVTWSTAALLAKRVQAGEQADALILIKGDIETLSKVAKVTPGTETIFAQSIFAIGVKAGAPKPDISTVDALKKSLLAAKGVSYSNPATAAPAAFISPSR